MLTDQQARTAVKELVVKYLKGVAPDYQLLIELMEDPSQQVPIRGVLEDIRQYCNARYTQQELEHIDDCLYIFG
jgi:hypothetical protein